MTVGTGPAGVGSGRSWQHHFDDMARGAELAVLPGGGDFAKYVLVQVTLGVAVFHGDAIDHIDAFSEQTGLFGHPSRAGRRRYRRPGFS